LRKAVATFANLSRVLITKKGEGEMRKAALAGLLLAFVAGSVFSQTVNICGTVRDAAGKPLTKTLVRLGQTRVTDAYGNEPYFTTTDQNGQYHLGTGTCTVNTLIPNSQMRGDAFSKPVYIGGKVLFSLPQSDALVRMSMYDVGGRFVREVMNRSLSKGNYSVAIDTRGISSQYYLLRVTINGVATVMRVQPAFHSTGGSIVQNTPEFQTRLEKLAAVVDTLHATEPGYTLGVTPIEALAGQFDFTLTKNHAFNGDTDAFWDTAHVKKEAGHFWYTVINRTNGQVPDSMIYLAIGDGGAPFRLSDQNTIDFSTSASGRLYIMVGYKPAAGNYRPNNQVWDFEEHTNGGGWFHGNTTRVDAFGTPIAYRLHCTDGFDTCRGELPHVFYQARQSFFDEFTNEVPYEFTDIAKIQAPYKIPHPGYPGTALASDGKYAHYSDKYLQAFGAPVNPGYLSNLGGPQTEGNSHRHVLGMTTAQAADGNNFYKATPCDFYANFLHRRAFDSKCYAFPYDDYNNWSSYIEHGNVSWLILAIGY
jgi:Beta-1,3-glucanase